MQCQIYTTKMDFKLEASAFIVIAAVFEKIFF
jgi:hypothetical protein